MFVFLSPHFDDVALSCGGVAWQLVQSGQAVEIWTVCAGPIPPGPLTPFAQSLHERWGAGMAAVGVRRGEDEAACLRLGARGVYYDLPDCIYRRLPENGEPLIEGEDDLWQPYPPGQQPEVERLADWLADRLPREARLVLPLALGGHMDHRLVRAAGERLNRRLWYYADYPYVARHSINIRTWLGKRWRALPFRIPAAGVEAWQAAVSAYTSQIGSFWKSIEEMELVIAEYSRQAPGHSLYYRG